MKNIYQQAAEVLKNGGVIAYPTEAVFGLGCDPFNEQAVQKILQLKQRSMDKGLILIAANWEQVKNLVLQIDKDLLTKVLATWPGPNTWVFPASKQCPKWVTGKFNSVALRITAHPIAKTICEEFGGPIVSTSANIEGSSPARTKQEVEKQFPQGIDLFVPGEIGNQTAPTLIRDVLTNKIIRG
jgi:L-threonylcarbamoyladenylate synthase